MEMGRPSSASSLSSLRDEKQRIPRHERQSQPRRRRMSKCVAILVVVCSTTRTALAFHHSGSGLARPATGGGECTQRRAGSSPWSSSRSSSSRSNGLGGGSSRSSSRRGSSRHGGSSARGRQSVMLLPGGIGRGGAPAMPSMPSILQQRHEGRGVGDGASESGPLGSWRRKSTVVMGIPKLFRWLTDQYPAINQRIEEGLSAHTEPIDNFYLDMNGIIHMCTHANSDSFVELNEKEMFKRIFIYTDRLYKLVEPRRLLYLAVDGVAPRAKMNQQRSRRFRSSKEAEQLMASIVAREGILPPQNKFDSNCITPGTDFMLKLCVAFREWIAFKMETDPFWQTGAKVVFSGPDVPGEGEHKVMDYIREGRANDEDWHDDLRHCLYGLDADLIMLSLVTHEQNFHLLREKMSVRHTGRRKPKDPIHYNRDDFELLEVAMLREMLRLQFRPQAENPNLGFKFELKRVIDDFVFMCILVGNDFLPHVPHLDIAEGALNLLLTIYGNLLPTFGGYLTNKDQIHLGRLELFLHEVSRREAYYFQTRGAEEFNEDFQDATKYKDAYYRDKMKYSPEDVEEKRKMVMHYIEGLYWVLKYYHCGVDRASWSWYYPYLYAPLGSDLKDLAGLDIKFDLGRPFPSLIQLISVLPPQSAPFLPESYQALMLDEDSPILPFYPKDFECDANGKRNSWETVVQIPFIDEPQMFDALNEIDHVGELTQMERLQNKGGVVWSFPPPRPRKSGPKGADGQGQGQGQGQGRGRKKAPSQKSSRPDERASRKFKAGAQWKDGTK